MSADGTPELLPGPLNEPACDAEIDGFSCTRRVGHVGDHAAHGTRSIVPLYIWPQDTKDGAQ